MRQENAPYDEGTWFAVPLRTSGYAVGVVARKSGDGPVFGYFFGPRRDCVPNLAETSALSARQAIWIGQFGDLGLLNGKWPMIGQASNWRRALWPLPPFIRVDDFSGTATRAIYSNDDLTLLSEEPCDPELARSHPKDALSGYGAVEIRLTDLLNA